MVSLFLSKTVRIGTLKERGVYRKVGAPFFVQHVGLFEKELPNQQYGQTMKQQYAISSMSSHLVRVGNPKAGSEIIAKNLNVLQMKSIETGGNA